MVSIPTKTRPATRANAGVETMRALVWNGPGKVAVERRTRPTLAHPSDALVRVTATTICGSDLHLFHGAVPSLKKGDVLGHEFMGIVEAVGADVAAVRPGDRVVVSAVIADGTCDYCQRGLFSLCEGTNVNPAMTKLYGQHLAGVFGYSHMMGGYEGGQAEYVRVPFADVGCLGVPAELTDEQVLFLSDIACTAWHGNELGEVGPGDVVGVWGSGPVGLLVQAWARYRGAARIIAIDCVPERLAVAHARGAEVIDFRAQDPFESLRAMTAGEGVDVAIEAVGFRYPRTLLHKLQRRLALETDTADVLGEVFRGVKKGGRVSIIGDYLGYANRFPVGAMMEKGLTVRGGQVHVQRYWRDLLAIIQRGEFDPTFVVTHHMTLDEAAQAYSLFDERRDGVLKVILRP